MIYDDQHQHPQYSLKGRQEEGNNGSPFECVPLFLSVLCHLYEDRQQKVKRRVCKMTVRMEEQDQTKEEASGRSETGSPQHSGLKIATALLQAVENGVVAKIVVVEQGVDCANPA